jgi:hypothetical protein
VREVLRPVLGVVPGDEADRRDEREDWHAEEAEQTVGSVMVRKSKPDRAYPNMLWRMLLQEVA